ncbi:two-component sensor histidine kinase, partial [Arthrobacter sp. HMWF013]
MVLHPELKWSGPFLYSLAAHLVLLAACAIVPWERLPKRAVLIIPALDCLAIGLSREAGDQYLAVLGFLLVFPVVWLSAGKHPSGVVLAILATILSAVLPPVILGTGFTSASFIRIVLLPVILGAIALTAHGVANAISSQRRLLQDRAIEVRKLLTASENREQLLGTVLDTVSVGVCALDDQGRTILTNHHHGSQLAEPLSDPSEVGTDRIPVYGTDREHPLPPERHPRTRAARGEAFTDELIW